MYAVLCNSPSAASTVMGWGQYLWMAKYYGKFVHMWKNLAKVCAKLETVFVKFATHFRQFLLRA